MRSLLSPDFESPLMRCKFPFPTSSVARVNFSVSIGTRVPRQGVTFRPLPVEVVTIYPEWRGYEFFLVRDQIIVVDPRTLEIVAVLDV